MMITLSILMLVAKQNPANSLLRWIAGCAESFARFCERREAIEILRGLDDHELKDLGISRCRIEQAVQGRALSQRRWEMNQ
jgi:uncharacterized protein YjiS (DUF1127 family)